MYPLKIKRANRLPKVGLPYSVFNYTIFRHCPQGVILCFSGRRGRRPLQLTVWFTKQSRHRIYYFFFILYGQSGTPVPTKYAVIIFSIVGLLTNCPKTAPSDEGAVERKRNWGREIFSVSFFSPSVTVTPRHTQRVPVPFVTSWHFPTLWGITL